MQAGSILGWKSVQVITWVAPAIGIPALRYLHDAKDRRKELFLRDATTYSLGTVIYFAVGFLTKKLLTALNLFKNAANRDFASFLMAITANILYAGIGAVKLSQYYAHKQNEKTGSPIPGPTFRVPSGSMNISIKPPAMFSGFSSYAGPSAPGTGFDRQGNFQAQG